MVNAIIVPVALTGLLFCQINSLIFFYIKTIPFLGAVFLYLHHGKRTSNIWD
jgi:hypothetical protein